MPGKPYFLRYFVVLEPQNETIIYQNLQWLIPGHAGYCGRPWGQWEAIISPGPWWDGIKDPFVLYEPFWWPLSHDEVLSWLIFWYGLDRIWISWTMKEWPDIGGCAMWVQKADTPKPHHWRVWHTPIPHPRDVLLTESPQWTDWGWYDDVTTAPRKKPEPKAKPKKAKAKNLILHLRGNTTKAKGASDDKAKSEGEGDDEAKAEGEAEDKAKAEPPENDKAKARLIAALNLSSNAGFGKFNC